MVRYGPFGKRLVDVAVSSVLLLVAAPAMGAVAVAVRVKLGRSVLFVQRRVGRDERVFHIYKFRSMHHASEARTTDPERLTTFGVWLRKSSLDELPQLFNVLRGDMSLVGPRPLLVPYLERYSPKQRWRHRVAPGITGLAQVSGRNSMSWDAKFHADVDYVMTWSPRSELSILARTLPAVLWRRGVSGGASATMTEFKGSQS